MHHHLVRRTFAPLGALAFSAILAVSAIGAPLQGPPGHDHHNPPPGHGGMPPGQAKKYDRYNDWRFREDDRNHFYSHYRHDADRWRGRKRPVFVRGQAIPSGYRIQPVPSSYWQGVPPPPQGYQYGYYDGYVVAYNPTTRIVADVLDLVTAAVAR